MNAVSHKDPMWRPGFALILQLTVLTEYNESQHWRYRVFLISDLETDQQVKFTVYGPIFSLSLLPPLKTLPHFMLTLQSRSALLKKKKEIKTF